LISKSRLLSSLLVIGGCSVADPQNLPSGLGAPLATTSVEVAASPPPARSATAGPVSATPVEATRPEPCPGDMVLVGRFCVDRYEAHLVTLSASGGREVHPHNQRPREGAKYTAANGPGVFPQGYISRPESEAACDAAGKRLCSRVEWQKACVGTPSAQRSPRSPCNGGKQHLLTLKFNQPFQYDAHFNDPALNTEPGFLARTGEYEACTSEVGAHDMVGNLHEWVSGTVTRALIVELESDGMRRQWQPAQVGNATFMGGFYSTSGEHGPGCAFTTIAHEAAYHDYSTGFRCCRDALSAL
jgi:formylglycine-generating enzyme